MKQAFEKSEKVVQMPRKGALILQGDPEPAEAVFARLDCTFPPVPEAVLELCAGVVAVEPGEGREAAHLLRKWKSKGHARPAILAVADVLARGGYHDSATTLRMLWHEGVEP